MSAGSMGGLSWKMSVTGAEQATAQINEAGAAATTTANSFQQGQKSAFGFGLNMKKAGLLAQQGSYGVQDFLIVLKDGGWQRGLMASSNNLAQMFSLVNPMAGAIGGLAVTVAALAPSLWEMATAEEEVTDKTEKLKEAQSRLNEELSRRLKLHRDMVALEKDVDAGKADKIQEAINIKGGEVAGPLKGAVETARKDVANAIAGFLNEQEFDAQARIKEELGRSVARNRGLGDIASNLSPEEAQKFTTGGRIAEERRRREERIRLGNEALRSGSVSQMDMQSAVRNVAVTPGTFGDDRLREFNEYMSGFNKNLQDSEKKLREATAELDRFKDSLADAKAAQREKMVQSAAEKAASALERIASTNTVSTLEGIMRDSRKRVADAANDATVRKAEDTVMEAAQAKIDEVKRNKQAKIDQREAESVARDRAAFKKKLEQKEIQSMGPVERLAAERDKMITEAKEAFSPKPTDTREQGFRNDADLLIAVDRINEIFSSKAKSLIKEIPKPKGMSGQSDLVSFTKQLQSNILGAGDIQKRQLAKQEDIAKTNKQAADLLKTIANSWKGGIPVAAS